VKSPGKGQASPNDEEIKKLVEDHLQNSQQVSAEVYSQINQILFSPRSDSPHRQ
jgi:ribosomal protein L18E